jgi:hypothetical protein
MLGALRAHRASAVGGRAELDVEPGRPAHRGGDDGSAPVARRRIARAARPGARRTGRSPRAAAGPAGGC